MFFYSVDLKGIDRPLVKVLMAVYPVHPSDWLEAAGDGNSHCGHHDVGLS